MTKPVIILYSHQANLAGAPLSLATLANALRADYHCIFVTPAKGAVLDRVKCETIVLGTAFQTVKLIKIIKDRHAVLVHANTILAQPAVLAAKLTNTKLVWHIREDLSAFPARLPQRILAQSDRTIIISDSMTVYFPPSPKIIRIYNGIEPIKLKKKRKNTVPVILFAGTIEPRKGVRELLLAIKILTTLSDTPFKLHIYGKALPGTKRYLNTLLRFIHENRLENYIEFKGVTSAIRKAIAEADIIAIPSLAEPFGRVAIEAMSVAKPVVASRTGGLPEIVKDGTTGLLFTRGMSTDLAAKLASLLKNPKRAKALGKAGYERYKKNFTMDIHVKEIKKVYQQLLQ